MSAVPPRVTVLTPAYNAAATIRASVNSALAQTIADIEVIVADDGSSVPVDAALQDVRDERLRVIRSDVNHGVSAARNAALAAARAPVVAQLDADDLWRPDHLEGVLPAFDDPAIGLAYTNVEIIGTPLLDRAIAVRTPGDQYPDWLSDRSQHPVNDLAELYKVNPVPSPGVVMRTAAVRALGGYPRWLAVGEDYYLYIKLRRAGWRFAYVDRTSAVYRWPDRERGVSYDVRHGLRQNLKLFAVLAVQTPGERAIWGRLCNVIVEIVATHVPGAVSVGRRVRRLLRRLRS